MTNGEVAATLAALNQQLKALVAELRLIREELGGEDGAEETSRPPKLKRSRGK